ncbi:hypothetical protein NQ023_09390 [Corynebacterium phoceense]|uniref:hypothetical protein n=1 Tax=Corynebacterium phoceense TaxID=1686286 RepID=UPI00211B8DBA|nr:hypothetical protein [Corynebacterium phoceense]MCQ9331938.1 hypothetical protein [Corynebacterium phoceense]MCQ9346487.1 hypothetical protein [Corynebacterium phoceense]MCQ9348673.1 hypothetical protein [Corynebacterium phoceense]
MSSSDLEPPRGGNNKKKVWIAIVGAIATQTLGTLAANYLIVAIDQWLASLTGEASVP